jgi:hypothetical protein
MHITADHQQDHTPNSDVWYETPGHTEALFMPGALQYGGWHFSRTQYDLDCLAWTSTIKLPHWDTMWASLNTDGDIGKAGAGDTHCPGWQQNMWHPLQNYWTTHTKLCRCAGKHIW